jgi:hypothetical protein
MKNLLATAVLSTAASLAVAHDGHGMVGAHWHASDALGFVLIGVVVAALAWLWRGK